MAAAKTSGNTTANPIEDVAKKLAELNEEAAQKLAVFAEQATKQLTEFTEQAATEQPKVEIPNLADVTREFTTAYTTAARQLL